MGVADGDSSGDGDGVDNVDGADTVPTLFGLTDGVGVAVETSIGAGDGVSVGLGVCPKATSAIRDVSRANPRRLFRIRG
jgi:hypothetical protein